jgi:hypothetical protein
MGPLNRSEESVVTPTLDEVFSPWGVAVVGAGLSPQSFLSRVGRSFFERSQVPRYLSQSIRSARAALLREPQGYSGAVDHVIVSIPAESVLKLLGDCRHL